MKKQSWNERYEYVFSSVPVSERKSTGELALIFAGFSFACSALTVGGLIGWCMPFSEAVAVCAAGNAVLFVIALFWGLIGYETGNSSIVLVRRLLGNRMAILTAVYLVLFLMAWCGMNGDLLAQMIVCVFPKTQIPMPVLSACTVLVSVVFSIFGWRGMKILSQISVPILIILTVYQLVHIGMLKGGWQFLLDYQPQSEMSFLRALGIVVGSFSLSATTTPDLCRFAKSRRAVFCCITVYAGLLMLSNVCGIVVVQATGARNTNYGFALLGLVIPSFFWSMLCMYTTQNVNMYIGSLAVQNLVRRTKLGGNLSHWRVTYMMGCLSIIAAATGITKYFVSVTQLLLRAVVPLTILMAIAVFQKKIRCKWCIRQKNDLWMVSFFLSMLAMDIGEGLSLFEKIFFQAAVYIGVYLAVFAWEEYKKSCAYDTVLLHNSMDESIIEKQSGTSAEENKTHGRVRHGIF